MTLPSQNFFTVIIPSHHRPELLQRAVTALEKQSLPLESFEVSIVLSPNDSSLEWLSNYRGPLHLKFEAPKEDLYQGRNVSFKRNYGAAKAQTPWLAFTDDDCVPSPQWLEKAMQAIQSGQPAGIEGKTVTPETSPHTLTWKGMQRLGRPGGYQTCNVFYKKDVFLAANGFDFKNFPWFLEDTDMAWSVLDQNQSIEFVEEAIVFHPVGDAAPWRLIHEAKNSGLKVRLYQKHPELYQQKKMRILRASHYLYILLLICLVTSAVLQQKIFFLFTLVVLLTVHASHLIKMFSGVTKTPNEIWAVSWRTIFYGPIALIATLKELLTRKSLRLADLRLLLP